MIFDRIEYLDKLPLKAEARRKIIAFLKKAPQLPHEKHEIIGKEVYASISSYATKLHENGFFEAHRQYADIQVLLAGEELVGISQDAAIAVTTPYDATRDVVIMDRKTAEYSEIKLMPGYFALFMPRDLHMPCLAVKKPSSVIKVVFKVAVELFR